MQVGQIVLVQMLLFPTVTSYKLRACPFLRKAYSLVARKHRELGFALCSQPPVIF